MMKGIKQALEAGVSPLKVMTATHGDALRNEYFVL